MRLNATDTRAAADDIKDALRRLERAITDRDAAGVQNAATYLSGAAANLAASEIAFGMTGGARR